MKTSSKFKHPLVQSLSLATLTIVSLQGCGSGSASSAKPAIESSSVSDRSPSSNAMGEELFSDAEAQGQAQALGDETSIPSLRERFVNVNIELLKRAALGPMPASSLKLNLFADKNVEATIEDIQKLSENNIVFTGRIIGDDDSAVTLVLNNGVLVGNVNYGDRDEQYEIRYAGGTHVIRVPDATRDTQQDCEPVQLANGEQAESPVIGTEPGENGVQAAPVIDMLVAYTPRARYYQGGTDAIKALIQMGIADTNAAYANSGVNLQVRLVGTIETAQNETTSMSNDLYSLRSKTDSRFNEVHAERTRVGADQVTLVAAYKGISTAAGIGFYRTAAASAFTVVKSAYFGQYTFTHELGHNIGLDHSDGYVNSSGRFRTIMAYGSYTRIRRFSNPSMTYSGYRTGTSYQNSASILNARGGITAALYSTKIL